MSNLPQLSNIPLLRRSPRLAEIEVLLDLFPTPMLLVESRQKRILLANAKATELTTYTRDELSRMKFPMLFVNMDDRGYWRRQPNEVPWILTLVKRNKSQVEVQVSHNEIQSLADWMLVSLEPVSQIAQREVEQRRQEELWNCLHTLSVASQQDDLDSALSMILQASTVLTGASVLAIYRADGNNLELRRCAYLGPPLPESLPSQELIHARTPHLWRPGKRPHISLDYAARSAGYQYLATAPLGQPNALIGLMAIADTRIEPDEQIQPLLRVLAGAVTTALQKHALAENLSEKLLEQQRQLNLREAALQAVRDSAIVLSYNLTIKAMNPSAESTLGYSQQEAFGQPIEKILIGSETVLPAIRMALEGVPTLDQTDIRLYRRSGEAFLAQISIIPVLEKESVQGAVVLIQDQSEQERIQNRAQQLEQRALLGEVVAIFAHEVRNPISAISSGLQLLEYNLQPEDPNQETISRLKEDCDRLKDYLNSVLSFSRPTEYRMGPLDLGIHLKHLLDRMKPKISQANVQTQLQVEDDLPQVRGNASALEQVFTNLIVNALQAMEDKKGGTLAIKLRRIQSPGEREEVEISVADDGPGIPKELIDRIFLPFVTTKSNGTGLGLAIAKRIITAHKGNIIVESFPGGTVFSTRLPVYVKSSDG